MDRTIAKNSLNKQILKQVNVHSSTKAKKTHHYLNPPSKGLSQQSLCAFMEHFDRILAIIRMPFAILQHITTLMNNLIQSNILDSGNRFAMRPMPKWIMSNTAMENTFQGEILLGVSYWKSKDKFNSHRMNCAYYHLLKKQVHAFRN